MARTIHRGPRKPVRRGFLPQPLWLPSDLICSPTVPGRVSVICPAHNAERFLPEAIRSCLWQEPHPPDEIVLVDDGSTDETNRKRMAKAGKASAKAFHIEKIAGEWAEFLREVG